MSTESSIAHIAPLRGEFACATTEAGFLHQQSGLILRNLRRAVVFCSLVYVLFGITDVMALGLRDAIGPVLARLTLPLLAFPCLRRVRRAANPVNAAYRMASFATVLGMGSYLAIVFFRPEDLLLHGMSVALMAVVVLIFVPNRQRDALAITLACSILFLLLAWHQQAADTRILVTMGSLVLFANGFGAIAANRHARLWREQYWAQQVLTNLSIRDPLTGCYNRRHLNASLLDGEIARARRYRLNLSLIMCDLDGFKAINDTYGHHAGDELLRVFAGLLQSLTREGVDTVVRYGGEEFLVILPETALDGGVELAERIRAAFAAQRVAYDGMELGTTASFGVVGANFAATQAVTPRALIAAADELMYDAKRGGRNQVRSHQFMPHIGRVA